MGKTFLCLTLVIDNPNKDQFIDVKQISLSNVNSTKVNQNHFPVGPPPLPIILVNPPLPIILVNEVSFRTLSNLIKECKHNL